MTTRFAAVALCVLLQLTLASWLQAQTILSMPPSPEANGRGGLYFSTATDDPFAPLTNPGFLGFLVERNRAAAGLYPSAAAWYPEYNYSYDSKVSYGYTGQALFFGIDHGTLGKILHTNCPFSIGFGYQNVSYTYNSSYSYSHSSGSFEYADKMRLLSVGIGYHSTYLQAGLGMNLKKVNVDWYDQDTDFSASDFGLILQLPMEKILCKDNPAQNWQPFITPMLGYAISNVGGQHRYEGSSFGQPIPRSSALSLSLSTGLRAQSVGKGNVDVIAISVGEQIGDNLVNYHKGGPQMIHFPAPSFYYRTYSYRNPLGDLQPFNDLILGKAREAVSRQQGIEISLLEAGYLRWGHIKTAFTYSYSPYYSDGAHYSAGSFIRENYSTSGFGLRLSGMLKVLSASQAMNGSAAVAFLAHHLDIQYQYAIRHDDVNWRTIHDGTSFHEIVVLLK